MEKLLQRFLNNDSNANGHADHGVVACAQEAHHFHIKPHLRWCLHWDTTTFSAGNPIFHKTRSTSFESMMMCFPSLGTSYHIMCSRNKCFNLNYTPRTSFIIFSHLLRSTKSNEAFPILSASKNKLKKDYLFADLSNNIGQVRLYNKAIKIEGNKTSENKNKGCDRRSCQKAERKKL